MKSKNNRRKKVMSVLLIGLGVILLLNIVGFIINTALFKNELEAVQPYGQMIEVKGTNMHVYSMGDGEETIVLLPGFGVALPSADFGPLMRALSEKYKVVTVEYFGVGFSEETTIPRTNENYINEVRTVLDQAGFKPPYVLMPHSASGIYSEYYAAKYPEEVSAIIMLDTTSTAQINEPSAPSLIYSIAKLQQATGFTRLMTSLVPDTRPVGNGYTKKEITDYKLFNNHVVNNTMINQSELLVENIKEVNQIPFPKDIPVLKILSKQTVDGMAKRYKDDGMGYQNAHLNRLGEKASCEIVNATHFIYHSKVDEIIKVTNEFLTDTK